jgi:hypothetical protein
MPEGNADRAQGLGHRLRETVERRSRLRCSKASTEVCTGTAKTKEQPQRRAFNLIPIMVYNDRPTCKDRHAAELIMARRDIST